jgi:hypothetical protein
VAKQRNQPPFPCGGFCRVAVPIIFSSSFVLRLKHTKVFFVKFVSSHMSEEPSASNAVSSSANLSVVDGHQSFLSTLWERYLVVKQMLQTDQCPFKLRLGVGEALVDFTFPYDGCHLVYLRDIPQLSSHIRANEWLFMVRGFSQLFFMSPPPIDLCFCFQ